MVLIIHLRFSCCAPCEQMKWYSSFDHYFFGRRQQHPSAVRISLYKKAALEKISKIHNKTPAMEFVAYEVSGL